MDETHWQIQIFKKSIKKKDKLRLLQNHTDIKPSYKILDLGCAQGILSYYLKKRGGMWVHADQDESNVKTSRELLHDRLIQVGSQYLPFKTQIFDMVISLDYLEHLDNDQLCLQEIHRILKKQGQLVIATPHTGLFYVLHKVKPFLGLKLESYGHKREGYNYKTLINMLENEGFQIMRYKTFSRFFSEFLELILNVLYIRFSKPPSHSQRNGHIRPTTPGEFRSKKKSFRFYSMIYPLVWLISRLDHLLFFSKGYSLIIWASKMD